MADFDVFISYHRDILHKVKQLHKFISQHNRLKTWIDIHDMTTTNSQWLFTEIAKGITSSKVIVACITKAYSQSLNCQREINLAIDQKKPIIVMMYEDISLVDLGAFGILIAPLLRIHLSEIIHDSIRDYTETEINYALLPNLKKLLNTADQNHPEDKPFSNVHMLLKFKNESSNILDFKYLKDDLVACVEQQREGDQKKSLIVRKFDGSIQKTIDFVPTLMFFYPKQKLFLAASTEPEFFSWTTTYNYHKISYKTDAPIRAFDILDNDFLVTMSENDVSLWKYAANLFSLLKKANCSVEGERFACIKALPENKLACGLTNSMVFILDFDLKQVISFKAHEKGLSCLTYTLIKDFLISLSAKDKRVKLWDYKKGECVGEIVLDDDDYTIKDYLVILAKRYFGVVCGDMCSNKLIIYDSFDIEQIKRFNDFDLYSEHFRGLDFIEDHRYCVLYNINDFSVIKFK